MKKKRREDEEEEKPASAGEVVTGGKGIQDPAPPPTAEKLDIRFEGAPIALPIESLPPTPTLLLTDGQEREPPNE